MTDLVFTLLGKWFQSSSSDDNICSICLAADCPTDRGEMMRLIRTGMATEGEMKLSLYSSC